MLNLICCINDVGGVARGSSSCIIVGVVAGGMRSFDWFGMSLYKFINLEW